MKILLPILLIITVTFNLQAIEYDKQTQTNLKQRNVYFGDPRENQIIVKGDQYLIIHNPTELALTVMKIGATNYCKENLGDNFTADFMQILARYTAYFSCAKENKADSYNLNNEDKKCIKDRSTATSRKCLTLNEKNIKIINEIESQIIKEKKYQNENFFNKIKTQNYDEIEIFEQAAENIRINKIKEAENKQILKHLEICKKYKFKEGSDLFGSCIIELIKTGVEKYK